MSDVLAWAKWLADAVAQTVGGRFCRPAATYRLQFEPGKLTFRDAAAIVPYLDELGISHLYAVSLFENPRRAAATATPSSITRN